MFPMIANVAEYEAAKAIALRELDHILRHNYPEPRSLQGLWALG